LTTRPSKRHGCLSERFVLRRLMEHLGSTLRKIARERDFDVTVSKQKLNKVELIELVRRQREDATQDLVYSARPFILCGLPVKRPPADTLIHRRRNGHFFLHIQGHPDFGLPFGQDRLIAIWVASLAVRQKSRVIEFETASKILEEFGMPRNGFHCRRLIDGFKRIFASTIFFGNEGQAPTQELFTCARFCFFDRMRVWYTGENHGQKLRQSVNRIELSEQFWREIQVHPIPAERHAVRGLANSPGCLDFYLWLSWRSHTARKIERVSLFGPAGLVHQLGSEDYGRPRDFRRTITRWLKAITLYWPECQAQLSSDGRALLIQSARAIHSRV
jgi:Plasmid encoded RepA protein.